MKKLSKLLLGMALLVLCACGGATYINTSSDLVNFPIEGGEESINIEADGSWEMVSSPDWVTTEVQENGLVIKTGPNKTGKSLQGDIVLKGKEGVEVSIKVMQATKCSHITPAEESVDFDKEGGTKTVNIDTDGTIQVEAPEGFTATYADGVLSVTAEANDGGKRSGEISLTADDQSATISVSQHGKICPRCKGTGKVKCTKCGGWGYTSIWDTKQDYGCRSCGGRGYRDCHMGPDLSWSGDDNFYTSYGFRKGSGRMNCPACGGSGE